MSTCSLHPKNSPYPSTRESSVRVGTYEEGSGNFKGRGAYPMVLWDGGTVHICVDLKLLNESVLREAHPKDLFEHIMTYIVNLMSC